MAMVKADSACRIVWRPIAEADLDKVVDDIAQDEPAELEAFAQALREKILLLARHPERGRSGGPGRPTFLREWLVRQRYTIFYRALAEAHTVEILRIKYAVQNAR